MNTPRRLLVMMGVALAVGCATREAAAQCAFQHPLKTIEMRLPLVPAFVSCGGACNFCGFAEDSPQSPNAQTDTGVASCKPPLTHHQESGSPSGGWLWGPKGTGTVSFKAARNKFPFLPFNTADVSVTIKLNDVRDEQGLVGIGTPRFGSLVPSSRASVEARVNGDMTVVDLAVPSFPVPVTNGRASVRTSVNAGLANIAPNYSLPGCTLLELLKLELLDENGNVFAVPGVYLPNIDDPPPSSPTPTATPTPTSTAPTPTPTPEARCCEILPTPGGCADLVGVSPNDLRNKCDDLTGGNGRLAPQGDVCDPSVGSCGPMRGAETYCCHFEHPITGDHCIEGPTWDMGCNGGTITAGERCYSDGNCGPP